MVAAFDVGWVVSFTLLLVSFWLFAALYFRSCCAVLFHSMFFRPGYLFLSPAFLFPYLLPIFFFLLVFAPFVSLQLIRCDGLHMFSPRIQCDWRFMAESCCFFCHVHAFISGSL